VSAKAPASQVIHGTAGADAARRQEAQWQITLAFGAAVIR
jgi:hypothetical protein